jgi:hypothetical protein
MQLPCHNCQVTDSAHQPISSADQTALTKSRGHMATPNGAQNALAANNDATAQNGGTPNNDPNNAAGGGKQPVDGQGGGGNNSGVKRYEYTEDRSDWVPRSRLNGENPQFKQRLTAAEQERDNLRQEVERERARIRALAGVEQPNEEAAKEEEARKLIEKWFPQLAAFKDLTPEQVQQVLSAGKRRRASTNASCASAISGC